MQEDKLLKLDRQTQANQFLLRISLTLPGTTSTSGRLEMPVLFLQQYFFSMLSCCFGIILSIYLHFGWTTCYGYFT